MGPYTHEIKEDRMVDEIVLSGFDIWGSGKVYAEVFTGLLYILIRPCQSNYFVMEF